jgi:hypothetical protein
MKKTLTTIFTCITFFYTSAQQVADTLFNPPIPNPAYQKEGGPVVWIDEAHTNFHTLQGRFKPFATILTRDGYRVKANKDTFSKAALQGGKILVIANALHPDNATNWTLPTPSAFTDREIEEVKTWVSEGGSLFLIADHMPFPGAAEKLAAVFGFKFYNGFAIKRGVGKDVFSPGDGLTESVITKGRNSGEIVSKLQTFTGQAFEIPKEATPIVVLDGKYEMKLPKTAWQFKKDTQVIPAENMVQGAFMKYGNGRIVIFGEAAMFTAQTQGGKTKMGMNDKSASQNVQFLLNTIHWLDSVIE